MDKSQQTVVNGAEEIFQYINLAFKTPEEKFRYIERNRTEFLKQFPLVAFMMSMGIFNKKAMRMLIKKIMNSGPDDDFIDNHANYMKYLYMCSGNRNVSKQGEAFRKGKQILADMFMKYESKKEEDRIIRDRQENLCNDIYEHLNS